MTTTASKPQILLLVEDNPGDAFHIQELLSLANEGRYRVYHVLDLKEARSSLALNKEVDVVILDLGLPDGNGTETVRSVRQLAEDVPIVVLTGNNDDELAISCISAGAQDYLCKENVGAASLTKAIKYAVTRRREADARKTQLQNLLSALPDAVVVYDRDNITRYANDAAIKLYESTPDRFIGAEVPFPVADEWLPEYQLVREGDIRDLDLKIVPFLWDSQPAFLACLRDNTEYRALTGQLRDAQKLEAIGRLAGGVAHDFNNLLTIINGYAETLLQDPGVLPGHRAPLLEILEAGRRAAGLTRQLLTFGRRSHAAPAPIDINKILGNMEGMIRRFIGEDIVIETELAAPPCTVFGNQNELEQVFMNLCINARDAMPQGGKLHIQTGQVVLDRNFCTMHANEVHPGTYVAISFSDTGTGISKQDLEHIFEPFFTTKEMGRGTGLGLATAHGIVRQMEGYISCYSEVGLGTAFRVYLPCREGRAAENVVPADANADDMRGTETILLVEDEKGVREIIRRTLQSSGYTVLTAEDGLAALRLIREHAGTIHLLITDVVMPNMSGATLAGKVLETHPAVRVLYMSGYPYNVISGHGILTGSEKLLQKPFSGKNLLGMVRATLAPLN